MNIKWEWYVLQVELHPKSADNDTMADNPQTL